MTLYKNQGGITGTDLQELVEEAYKIIENEMEKVVIFGKEEHKPKRIY